MSDTFYDHCDICIGTAEDKVGWLDVFSNARGRKALEALFPGLPISWGGRIPELKMPPGWRVVCLQLPNMIKKCPGHKVMTLKPLDPDSKDVNYYGLRLAVSLPKECRVITRSAAGKWDIVEHD